MKLSGNRTASIFDRYSIADAKAPEEGVENLAALDVGGGAAQGRADAVKRHNHGTISARTGEISPSGASSYLVVL